MVTPSSRGATRSASFVILEELIPLVEARQFLKETGSQQGTQS